MDGEKIRKYPFEINDSKINVSDIIKFGSDYVIGSNGAGLFKLSNGKLQKLEIRGEDEQRIRDLELLDQQLFIGTRNGLLVTRDLKVFKKSEGLSGYSISSVKRNSGKFYVSTFRDGIFEYDQKLDSIKLINLPSSDIAVRSLHLILLM